MEFLFKKWTNNPLNRHKNNRKILQANNGGNNIINNNNTIENKDIDENILNKNMIESNNLVNNNIANNNMEDTGGNLFTNKISNQLQIENHVENPSYELIDLVKKIENLPCKKPNKNTIISKGDFNSPIMLVGESPNEDDLMTPINGDKKLLLDKMFASVGIPNEKIYTTYMFFWDMEDKVLNKKDENLVLPILQEHISIKKPKLIITLGSVVAKSLLKLDGIMKYRGTFQEINIANETYWVFVTYSPSYIIKLNKYKEYEEDFLQIKNFLTNREIL
jgi:uracil-DNA glycosylase family 4